MRKLPAAILIGALTLMLTGCPQYGIIDDGTSVSFGPANEGMLLRPARLPARGEGFEIPRRWRNRGLNYGTDEMIAFLVETARRVRAELPGVSMQIADISWPHGGPSRWHRSHQSGRDVDILFIVRNSRGRVVELEDMIHFRANGTAVIELAEGGQKKLYFDVERNWVLIRNLIDNPVAEVQYIFVYDPLKQLLLDHARDIGEPEELVLAAGHLLRQPTFSAPHDDHFHARIYCAPTDRDVGL